MRLDPNVIRQQIDMLLLSYPELAEDDQLRADMIEGSTELHEFLRQVEFKRQETVKLVEAAASHITDIAARKSRLERREVAMRGLMFRLMQIADVRKVELPIATLSIANGQPKVLITDEALLPDELCWFRREPNKGQIKHALKDGLVVRGATLSNAEPHLMIRK